MTTDAINTRNFSFYGNSSVSAAQIQWVFENLRLSSPAFATKVAEIIQANGNISIEMRDTGGIHGAGWGNLEAGGEWTGFIRLPADSFNGDYYPTSGGTGQFSFERLMAHELFHAHIDATDNQIGSNEYPAQEQDAVNFENLVRDQQLNYMGLPSETDRESHSQGEEDNSMGNNYFSNFLPLFTPENLQNLLQFILPFPIPTPDEQASPLVLDIDGDGIELSSLGSQNTFFDLKNTGQAVLTGWVSPDDGLLTLDQNNNGSIDNASELFGSEDTDGFSVLKSYDLNNDSVINSSDAIFVDLKVWIDSNSDGKSQYSELHTLAELGITKISLAATRVGNEEISGNAITHEAQFTINGVEQKIVDAWFSYDPTVTKNTIDYTLDEHFYSLPSLKGYGDLKDTYIAISIDNGTGSETLLNQLITFTDTRSFLNSILNWESTKIDVENILLRWGGVDNVNPASRGDYVDARHLEFYETFRGYAFDQYGRSNPLPEAGKFIEAVFDFIVTRETVDLIAQVSRDEIFENAYYNVAIGKLEGNLTLLQSAIDDVATTATVSNNAPDVWANFSQFIGYTKGLENLTSAELTALDAAVLATGDPSLSDWQDVVSYMTASLGSIIDSSDDWGSFEIYYDNLTSGTSGDDTIIDADAVYPVRGSWTNRGVLLR